MSKLTPQSLRPILVALLLAMPALLLAASPTQYEVQKLRPSDGADADLFGTSVAISGETAIVGAPLYGRYGSAYVYRLNPAGIWYEQAKLAASDQGSLRFGASVALSGDTAVIGNPAPYSRGSAYSYVRAPSGMWRQETSFMPSDIEAYAPDLFDLFGYSVAVSGDVAVVGAPHEDGISAGSAHVYTRDAAGGWLEQALTVDDGAANDRFGHSVAISGDTAVIGVRYDDDNGENSGSAFVYTRDAGGMWSERAKLLPRDGAAFEQFGFSVAISADTLVVGAFFGHSAYVYTRDAAGVWSEQAKLLPSDRSARGFGGSVAIDGDTVVVGAKHDDDNGANSGSAIVYARDTSGTWTEQAKLLASDGAESDYFGYSVAISGDNVVIGAQYDSDPYRHGGSAYVFDLRSIDEAVSLECPGDINGDGVAELVMVTGTGRVQVKDLAGAWVNGFQIAGPTRVVHTELMADTNTNGAPELVLLASGDMSAQVRDLLTGGALGSVAFSARLSPVDLEIIPDRNGNGIPELAGLGRDPMRLEVRDGLTGTLVSDMRFAHYLTGTALTVYPDLTGDGSPELVILADNRGTHGADKIEIRDVATGATVREVWLGKGWRVLEQERITDLNGNGSEELAVLRVHPSGNVNVQIRDSVRRSWANFVGFADEYPPKALVAIPDINGNGTDELVVFGRRIDGSNQKAVIKDSKTGQKLGQLWYDRNFPGKDFVRCGDINGNGSVDLALLGQRRRDGQIKVMLEDSKTGEHLGNVWF